MFIPRQKIVIYVTLSLIMVFPVLSSAEGTVIINEVAWMGTPVDGVDPGQWWRYEWIELYNSGADAISLDGYSIELSRDEIDFLISLSGSISSQQYFLIVASDKIPNGDLNYANLGGKFFNGGQRVLLKTAQGEIADEINARAYWPAGDNSTKQTMEWTGSYWAASLDPGGTPRTQNSVYGIEAPGDQEEGSPQPLPTNPPADSTGSPQLNQGQTNQAPKAKAVADKTEVVVNEDITLDASGSSDVNDDTLSFSWNFGDGNKSQEKIATHSYEKSGSYNIVLMASDGELESYDYLTIIVTEPTYSSQIFINEFLPSPSGPDEENEWLEIANESGTTIDLSRWQIDDEEGGSKPFIIPEGTAIAANSFLIFGRPQTKIALNNDGDSVRLIWPNGFATNEVNYDEKVKEGWSAARFPSSWDWTNSPTPGSANVLSYDTKAAATNKNSLSTRSSTLTSMVNPPPDASPDRDGGSDPTTVRTVEDAGNLKPAMQKAEARTPFSVLPAKYSAGVVALLVSLAGALAIFILKKRLKTPF